MEYIVDETNTEHFRQVTREAFEREIEHYGISDGMFRQKMDSEYSKYPAYVDGYKNGLTLEGIES